MKPLTGFGSLLAVSLVAATAAAQPLPGFGTMDRFDEQTKFATSLSYVGYDSDFLGDADVTTLRFDLFGQYMLPQGYGAYFMLPINHVSFSAEGIDDQSETGVGNAEVGGLYYIPGSLPVVLRGGLSLDTADSDTAGAGLITRITDFPSDIKGATWLRLSASPLLRRGTVFLRMDVGADIPVAEDEDEIDASTLLRLNVGGGIETGQVAIIGEFLALHSTDDADDDNSTLNMIAVTGRWMGGQVQPHLSFQLPLDDDLEEVVDWNLIVGLEYVIGASDATTAPASSSPPPPPGAY